MPWLTEDCGPAPGEVPPVDPPIDPVTPVGPVVPVEPVEMEPVETEPVDPTEVPIELGAVPRGPVETPTALGADVAPVVPTPTIPPGAPRLPADLESEPVWSVEEWRPGRPTTDCPSQLQSARPPRWISVQL
ncbi:hypothetical protein [Alsobacter sp. SYSU BS001988]